MGNNKAVTIMISMIVAIALVGAGGYFAFKHFSPKNKAEASAPSAEELEKLTVETEEITTNLADQAYIKIKFKIQVDNPDAAEELQKRLFQVNNIIIYEISNLKTADLSGQKGLTQLEDVLKKNISEIMQDGKVVRVYTTNKIIQ